MYEQISASLLGPLLKQHYAITLDGEPALLHERQGQQVFKVEAVGGEPLTVRLCQASRSKERVLTETGVLLFISRTDFPAPRLHLTLEGERVFQWRPGCWGYVLEYVEGKHPTIEPVPLPGTGPLIELAALAEEGRLLGRLHKMATSREDYPVEVGWLEEWGEAVGRAERLAASPEWSRQSAEILAALQGLPMAELKTLPLGFIHTDGHDANLLRTPAGRLYLLDWEGAGLGQALIDVSLLLGWLCAWRSHAGIVNPPQPPERYDFDEEYCRVFLAHYQQERPLSELERRMLGPLTRYLMAWYAGRDLEDQLKGPRAGEPSVTDGLGFTHWALMRSVTPHWDATLTRWATETKQ